MPLIIEGGRVPTRWADKRASSIGSQIWHGKCLSLALINNMPDPALEDTELQFFELLDIASGTLPVIVKLYSLTGIPRTDRGQHHLNSFYFDFTDLWNSRFDGVIITGTEPLQPSLQDEPYWATLTELFDWAKENTSSTVLSCLAAHASVLHGDSIPRHRLPDKQFGVFDSIRKCDHSLTSRIANRIRFPHSRWNEVRANELASCGYTVLTESAEAGVDLFVKKKKKSLFVHFQGHPEYGSRDSVERIPEGHQAISSSRERNISDSACGVLRRDRDSASERFSCDGDRRPARGSCCIVSGSTSDRRFAE